MRICFSLLCLAFALPALADDSKPVRIASGVSGHIHPALCISKKGTIVVLFSQSDYKDLKQSHSTDGGKTWSPPVPFPHTMSFYPGSLTTLNDGRLVHAWNVWYPQDKTKSRYVEFSTSSDEGKTWSAAKSLPKNPESHSVIRHPILELNANTWLFPLLDKTVVYDVKTGDVKPFADGHKHGLVPIVRTPRGTLISGAGLRSTDQGKTWEKVSPFPKIDQNGWRFDLTVLSNGWLVAGEVIGPGVGGDSWRFVMSRDDGKSWDFDNTYEFYNPGRPIGGRACPRSVQIDNGTLGTVFYDTDANQPGGSGVFFLRTPVAKLQGKAPGAKPGNGQAAIDLRSRRELFVDHFLIEKLDNVRLQMHALRDEGAVLPFDKPWEGPFSGYCTVIQDGPRYRLYYRGLPSSGVDGREREVTCYAESTDGIHWAKPDLGLFTVDGTKQNNVVLAEAAPATHNFSPFLDARPGVPADQQYKALGGTMKSGLLAFVSADGIRWRKLRDEPVLFKEVIPFPYMFDSQNVAFWSVSEGCYVSYFRVFKDRIRRIARSTSADFVKWTEPVLMEYRHHGAAAPLEHLYTSQTHPYFRAPQLYVATAARFFPGRQVLTPEQAQSLGVNPGYFKDTSDAILMTTRGGDQYERTFLEGFIRPGIGARNWVSRTNYPALNVVPTGPAEMSLYVNQDYAQPTAHLHRYTLRLDGFASARASYQGGELLTKPFTFSGKHLHINFATSAAGGVRVEIQDAAGQTLPGFTLADAREQIGNEIERIVAWQASDDVSRLVGQPIRLRFALKDADLYSLRFGE